MGIISQEYLHWEKKGESTNSLSFLLFSQIKKHYTALSITCARLGGKNARVWANLVMKCLPYRCQGLMTTLGGHKPPHPKNIPAHTQYLQGSQVLGPVQCRGHSLRVTVAGVVGESREIMRTQPTGRRLSEVVPWLVPCVSHRLAVWPRGIKGEVMPKSALKFGSGQSQPHGLVVAPRATWAMMVV